MKQTDIFLLGVTMTVNPVLTGDHPDIRISGNFLLVPKAAAYRHRYRFQRRHRRHYRPESKGRQGGTSLGAISRATGRIAEVYNHVHHLPPDAVVHSHREPHRRDRQGMSNRASMIVTEQYRRTCSLRSTPFTVTSLSPRTNGMRCRQRRKTGSSGWRDRHVPSHTNHRAWLILFYRMAI